MGRAFFPDYAIVAAPTIGLVDGTTKASGWVAMAGWEYVDFIVSTTDVDADATVNAKIRSADDSSGTNAADITGLAITQFTAAATNKTVLLRVRADQLNTADTHVECLVTVSNTADGAVIAIIGLGFGHNYGPASDYDAATVVEIKSI
jgi:hypothetical protein